MATYPPRGFTINAMICDTASSPEGKLYIHGGGWNLLTTNIFPFIQPRIAVAGVISVPYTETNKGHVLELRLEDEDGKRIPLGSTVTAPDGTAARAPEGIQAQFTLGRPPDLQAGDAQSLPIAINLDRVRFESPSAYSFVITIGGEEITRLPFRVAAFPGVVLASGGPGATA
ncbi:hypothetical protein AB0M35_17990 [Micromonospora sp. NPDC051196]|uniref:DUF6941 family protein n=1 Tax=Micromonospora sp. NPDC051196 TaxID=3155281 RepID=UPI003445B411